MNPNTPAITITGPDDDGDVVVTVFPGTPKETEIHVQQDPDGPPITVDDVSFDVETGELVVRSSNGRVQHYDLSFCL